MIFLRANNYDDIFTKPFHAKRTLFVQIEERNSILSALGQISLYKQTLQSTVYIKSNHCIDELYPEPFDMQTIVTLSNGYIIFRVILEKMAEF